MEIGKERIPKSFSALDRTDFWSPATEAERYFEGMDGSTWLFEERTAECPRAIAVWSPASKRNPEYLRGTDYSTTDVRDYSVYWCLGKDLLDLAKLAMPDPQLY
jgi:hypothetical protein